MGTKVPVNSCKSVLFDDPSHMTDEIAKFLLQQGVLGFTTLMLALVIVFLWRENKSIRNQADKALADERAKAAIELAAERKSHYETQEQRIKALEEGWRLSAEVKTTLNQTLAFVQRTVA